MCRWLAYTGEPVFLDELICKPEHSLVAQSLCAVEAKTPTNGDGFGIGWYGERAEPGLYREVLPAWNDQNLASLAHQIRSGLFFAHVRASTGTSSSRPNCHPFASGRWLFMHNGQIGGYLRLRRRLEALIPDALYDRREGTTDSEILFLMLLAEGLETDPLGALARTLAKVTEVMATAGVTQPLRFTSALTDGRSIYALRYASDDRPPSLYWRSGDAGGSGKAVSIVSEPLEEPETWQALPAGEVLLVGPDRQIRFEALDLHAWAAE
ncbi:class II glutamine amidotransferase [Pelagibius sp.]|uniref:class II glutamine amidotransferase n=1 Tax=Pelagibius sp. TaxID=1931238 RepID=UPI0026164428|nr:class II glutamine amidotransferase [Pelagibius sp.]